MEQRDEVRIPPKRLRLIGIFCGSLIYFPIAYLVVVNLLDAIRHEQNLILNLFPILVILAAVVLTPFFVLCAAWAFARLVFKVPAIIMTPVGIVNHSIIYHVFVPWDEIDAFVRDIPRPSQSRRSKSNDDILVLAKDDRRLYEMQQPVTKALLHLFSVLRPVNISTAMTAGTQAEVWAQLQRYVRKALPNSQIKFDIL